LLSEALFLRIIGATAGRYWIAKIRIINQLVERFFQMPVGSAQRHLRSPRAALLPQLLTMWVAPAGWKEPLYVFLCSVASLFARRRKGMPRQH